MISAARTNVRISLILFVSMLTTIESVAVSADDETLAEISRCSAIDAAPARLDCYDRLSGREPVAETAAPNEARLPDPVIGEDPPTGDEVVTAMVTRCQKDPYGRYVFYFDNGQVWKQSGNKRLILGDCNFEATITKDFFSHKLTRAGDDRRIRIMQVR